MAREVARIFQPLLGRAAAWQARRMMRGFHRSLHRFREVQERTLLEKVARNADSDVGRRFGFASVRSTDDFRRAVPLTTYDDYEASIDEVRRGRPQAVFGPGQTLHMFAMTSGTTRRPKYVPVTDAFLGEYRRGWTTWGIQAYLDHPAAFQGHVLQLVSAMDDEQAPCGLPCGAISGLTARMQSRAVRNVCVVPPEAADIRHTPTKYYVALLLALRQRTLVIASANPSTLLGLARTLGDRADELLTDLHGGTLSPSLDLPTPARDAVTRRLRADPARSRELSRAAADRGRLLPRDAWHLPFIACWKAGTLGLYLREFPRYFGDAPVRDVGLIASEGRMTIPLGDEGTAGVLDVESQFFEFLPARDGQRTGTETLLPHELEPGREYFLVMTNSAGLYRYDIGDVVCVTGFAGQSPLVEFLSKGAHYSSLTGEKLSEHQVVDAINDALAETGSRLSSYCLAPRWSDHAPYYVLLIEEPEAGGPAAASRFGGAVDRLLRSRNIEYNAKRSSGRLAALRVKVVPAGMWSEFDERTITERRRGIEQYKHKFLVGDVAFERDFPTLAEYGPEAPGPPGSA